MAATQQDPDSMWNSLQKVTWLMEHCVEDPQVSVQDVQSSGHWKCTAAHAATRKPKHLAHAVFPACKSAGDRQVACCVWSQKLV